MSEDCVCLYSGCEDPYHEIVSEDRVAAEPLVCEECRLPIVIGQSYDYYEGCDQDQLDEDEEPFEDAIIHKHIACLVCHEIRTILYCDGWCFGQLWEDTRDQLFAQGGMTSACLDKLKTVEAKQFLQRQWWKWVEEQAE